MKVKPAGYLFTRKLHVFVGLWAISLRSATFISPGWAPVALPAPSSGCKRLRPVLDSLQAANAVWSYTRRKCSQWKEAHYQLNLTDLWSRGTVKRYESLKPCLMKHFGLTNIHKPTWNICYLRLIWKDVFCFTVRVKIDGFLRIAKWSFPFP